MISSVDSSDTFFDLPPHPLKARQSHSLTGSLAHYHLDTLQTIGYNRLVPEPKQSVFKTGE